MEKNKYQCVFLYFKIITMPFILVPLNIYYYKTILFNIHCYECYSDLHNNILL